MTRSITHATLYSKSVGDAMEKALKSTLTAITSEAIVRALYNTGLGFYFLAIQAYGQAAQAFEAAAIFGSIAGAAWRRNGRRVEIEKRKHRRLGSRAGQLVDLERGCGRQLDRDGRGRGASGDLAHRRDQHRRRELRPEACRESHQARRPSGTLETCTEAPRCIVNRTKQRVRASTVSVFVPG
jgi:hypothetical protein